MSAVRKWGVVVGLSGGLLLAWDQGGWALLAVFLILMGDNMTKVEG